MNELNRLYVLILLCFGCKVDDDGKVTLWMNGKPYPLRIDGHDLYIPISEALAQGSDVKVYFHPTCENIISKETEIGKMVRRLASFRLLSIFKSMAIVFFDIANTKEKKSWSQNVYDVITPFKGVKKNVRDEFFEILNKLSIEVENNVDNRIVHFKTTKGGKTETGEKVYYKTKPSFPLYDVIIRELARSEGQAKNASVSVNDFSASREALELMVHYFRTVFPTVNNPDLCEYDATIPVAARFNSFMGCFGGLAENANRAQNMFRSEFDKKAIYVIDLSWQEKMEEIPELYRQVPELDYNSHNVYKEGEQQSAAMGNFDSYFNINSTQQQGAQAGQAVIGTTTPTIVNQGAGGQIRIINGLEYNFKVPAMMFGDRYLRSEPNLTANRINHYAMDMQNQMVIYVCTYMGNFLQRESAQQQMYNGYQQYPQQQYPYPQQSYPQQQYNGGYQQPAPTTVSNNIEPMETGW